jgi:hypothetical protein
MGSRFFFTAAIAAVVTVCATGARVQAQDLASCTSSIRVSFNQYGNAQIPAGATVWFSSVLQAVDVKPQDVAKTPVWIYVRNARVTFGSYPYTFNLPDAEIVLDASVTTPQRWWTNGSSWWVSFAPSRLPEAFFDGAPFFLREPFIPGKSGPVTWTATFSASRPGIALRWAWSAAAYSTFGRNGGLLVKPLSVPLGEPQPETYQNDDPAGTPELFKQYLIAGAMGNGPPHFTGARSKAAAVRACLSNETPPPAPPRLLYGNLVAQGASIEYVPPRNISGLSGGFHDPSFASSISQRVTFSNGRVAEVVDACDTGDLCMLIRYPNGERLAIYSRGAAHCEPYKLLFKRTNGSQTVYTFSRDIDYDTGSGMSASQCGSSKTTRISLDGGSIHLVISENPDGTLKFAIDTQNYPLHSP